MTKIYNTLGRTRGKKELEEARESMKDDNLVRFIHSKLRTVLKGTEHYIGHYSK